MMKKRVLFVDNDPDFLDTRSEQLEKAGFEVFKATSSGEAEQILHDQWLHLAIIDLRLRDDSDDRDTSGLALARNEAYRSIPKIILTRFPGYEQVREALGPALNGLPPAVDFLAKQEGPEAMLQAVEQAFAGHVRINWDLGIRWGEGLSCFHLLNRLEPELNRNRLLERVEELEDLFRRLFYHSRQITLGRLLARKQKGAVLAVFAFSEEDLTNQFVVICDQKEPGQPVAGQDQPLVAQAESKSGLARVNSAETVHFSATVYTLAEGDLEEVATLAEFYRQSPAEAVLAGLDHLFGTTLAAWYERDRFLEEQKTLKDFYSGRSGVTEAALAPAELSPRLEAICREALLAGLAQLDYSPHQLTLHLAAGAPVSYPNPVSCLPDTRLVFPPPLLCGLTYGQLPGESILVDRQGRTWPVDFSQVERGPLVRDFVSLETSIKLELLATLDIQTRYELESRLLAVADLTGEVDPEGLEPEAQKALRAIRRIRQQASAVIGNEPDIYLGGLLFCAAGQLAAYEPEVRHTRRELMPYLHSLLSAAMLCQKLLPPAREDLPPRALHSLWLDEANKEVWVEGRPAQISPQEFALLLYLYQRPSQLCSRAEIAQHIFDLKYGPDMSEREKKRVEESRLNSTMSRLRRKLEPNPDNPKYIIAIRGEGYRLELAD